MAEVVVPAALLAFTGVITAAGDEVLAGAALRSEALARPAGLCLAKLGRRVHGRGASLDVDGFVQVGTAAARSAPAASAWAKAGTLRAAMATRRRA